MLRRLIVLVTALATALAVAIPAVGAANQESATERYIVVFNGNDVDTSAISSAGGEVVSALDGAGVAIAESSDKNFAKNVKKQKGVFDAGLEGSHSLPYAVASETHESAPTGDDDLYTALQWDIRRVGADQAWNVTSGSHDTVVAVIDTGIASNHPDVAPNLVHADCYTIQPTCSAYPSLSDHGTHVAGTVAAAFGHGRVVGVGPDLGLAGYNVFEIFVDPEDGPIVVAFDGPIFEAMMDAADRGFDVINMSLGGYLSKADGRDAALAYRAWNKVADYVTRQGVTIVASAGNDAQDLNGPLTHIPSDVTGITNVGATGIQPDAVFPQDGFFDILAFYSNFGAPVTLTAPGGDCGQIGICDPATRPANWFEFLVLSSIVDLTSDPGCVVTEDCPVGYGWKGGTSMASPHVAGAAGLVKDANPGLSANQVANQLKKTADRIGSRQVFGHGILDVAEAVGN